MSGFIDYKSVRVDIVHNHSGKKELIYFDTVNKSLDILWLENDTLKIEGKTLKVGRDKFYR